MNLQQCVGINKKLTSIDNMLVQSCNSLKNLSNEFTEQCEVINDICKGVEEQRKRVVELKNIQLTTNTIENSEIIQKLLNSDDWRDRLAVAKLGFHLDKLKNDNDSTVRYAVVEQGAFLDELKDDRNQCVSNAARQKLEELEEQEVHNGDEPQS